MIWLRHWFKRHPDAYDYLVGAGRVWTHGPYGYILTPAGFAGGAINWAWGDPWFALVLAGGPLAALLISRRIESRSLSSSRP